MTPLKSGPSFGLADVRYGCKADTRPATQPFISVETHAASSTAAATKTNFRTDFLPLLSAHQP